MKLIARTSEKDPTLIDIVLHDKLLMQLEKSELAELRLFLAVVQDMIGIGCSFEVNMDWD